MSAGPCKPEEARAGSVSPPALEPDSDHNSTAGGVRSTAQPGALAALGTLPHERGSSWLGTTKGSGPAGPKQDPQPVSAPPPYFHPQPPSLPIARLSGPHGQSLALISHLAGQHGLWPQTDIGPDPGASTSQLGGLSLVVSLSEPGFLISKTGMIRSLLGMSGGLNRSVFVKDREQCLVCTSPI